MNEKKVREIFLRFRKADQKPTTELIYHNDFELLIAVILSAQATDKSVNKATQQLFQQANTPEKMLHLGEENLKSAIKTIGLYTSKARHIMAACRLLIDQFNAQVPRDRTSLESLPGVGRKTANVILNTCFGEAVIAVDTHIFRVANRIGLAHGKTPLEVEKQLMQCIPNEFKKNAHHWLILHGRYTCVARTPHCPDCIIRDLCEYTHKTKV